MRPLPRSTSKPHEQRHDRQPLHGHAQVAADHGRQTVRLALQGELRPLDLLEVLQLELEQLHHLHGQTGRADTDGRVLVRREHLLDVPLGDDVPHGGPAVTGEHHAPGEGHGHDGRPVRRLDHTLCRGQLPLPRQQLRLVLGEEVHEGRGPRRQEGSW